ncbi:hypothetical protein OH77DRAFT_653095 [Trametes cingulata]|nr:hypothetical protein OH77DRAFT_653095 [Trametes cingulata]
MRTSIPDVSQPTPQATQPQNQTHQTPTTQTHRYRANPPGLCTLHTTACTGLHTRPKPRPPLRDGGISASSPVWPWTSTGGPSTLERGVMHDRRTSTWTVQHAPPPLMSCVHWRMGWVGGAVRAAGTDYYSIWPRVFYHRPFTDAFRAIQMSGASDDVPVLSPYFEIL